MTDVDQFKFRRARLVELALNGFSVAEIRTLVSEIEDSISEQEASKAIAGTEVRQDIR